uniref:Uncharacterized protein n=1 Tax=Amphimedon queenslandica TaxID=400682 RepID=A0A1X7VKC3_AMPQE
MIEILKRMGLPVVPNLKYILKKCNTNRFLYLQSKKTDAGKANRKPCKRKRKVDEHKARRLFVQESAMVHDMGLNPNQKMQMQINGPQKDSQGERKSVPAPASDVIITSSDKCHSHSDPEQLDYDYEESADCDDLNVYPCTCPNYPRHKWYCPDNVSNRKRANDGYVTRYFLDSTTQTNFSFGEVFFSVACHKIMGKVPQPRLLVLRVLW